MGALEGSPSFRYGGHPSFHDSVAWLLSFLPSSRLSRVASCLRTNIGQRWGPRRGEAAGWETCSLREGRLLLQGQEAKAGRGSAMLVQGARRLGFGPPLEGNGQGEVGMRPGVSRRPGAGIVVIWVNPSLQGARENRVSPRGSLTTFRSLC